MSKISWFAVEADEELYDDDYTIAHGSGGLGVTYYFEPKAPSAFIVGGIGFSTWWAGSAPYEENTETEYGLGIVAGAGFEFSPHWQIEGDLSYGKPKDEDGGYEWSNSVLSLRVTINVVGY
jgi:hypothetical protein